MPVGSIGLRFGLGVSKSSVELQDFQVSKIRRKIHREFWGQWRLALECRGCLAVLIDARRGAISLLACIKV